MKAVILEILFTVTALLWSSIHGTEFSIRNMAFEDPQILSDAVLLALLNQTTLDSAVACSHLCLTVPTCQILAYQMKATYGRVLCKTFTASNSKEMTQTDLSFEGWQVLKKEDGIYENCDAALAQTGLQGGVYKLQNLGVQYCFALNTPSSRSTAWTLAAVINAEKTTFAHSSWLWTIPSVHRVSEALVAPLEEEGKFLSFLRQPVSLISIGLKGDGDFHWLLVYNGTQLASLHHVFSHKLAIPTAISHDKWIALANGFSLFPYCNRQGLNPYTNWISSRIGIITNNENNCLSPDKAIGLGLNHIACGCIGCSSNVNTCVIAIR